MNARRTTLLLCCFVLAALACKGGATVSAINANANTKTNAGANPADSGACALLSGADIQVVQGEAVSDSQGSTHSNGAFVTTQCFYRLPTFSKSVNLEIMRPAGVSEPARAVAEFWERRFHQPHEGKSEVEAEREMERARAGNRKQQGDVKGAGEHDRGEKREKEEAKAAQPKPVADIGDEAFWTGNQINASLYVRRSNAIIRLSVGGPDEQSVKIKKAKTLVEQVLKRL
jgi:hypothetical protein